MFAEHPHRPLSNRQEWAVVTDAATGVGYELAKCCAQAGYHLLITANDDRIHRAAVQLMSLGVRVETIDGGSLATPSGRAQLCSAARNKPIAFFFSDNGGPNRAPAGRVGHAPPSGEDPARIAQRIFQTARGEDSLPRRIRQRCHDLLTTLQERLAVHMQSGMYAASIRWSGLRAEPIRQEKARRSLQR